MNKIRFCVLSSDFNERESFQIIWSQSFLACIWPDKHRTRRNEHGCKQKQQATTATTNWNYIAWWVTGVSAKIEINDFVQMWASVWMHKDIDYFFVCMCVFSAALPRPLSHCDFFGLYIQIGGFFWLVGRLFVYLLWFVYSAFGGFKCMNWAVGAAHVPLCRCMQAETSTHLILNNKRNKTIEHCISLYENVYAKIN